MSKSNTQEVSPGLWTAWARTAAQPRLGLEPLGQFLPIPGPQFPWLNHERVQERTSEGPQGCHSVVPGARGSQLGYTQQWLPVSEKAPGLQMRKMGLSTHFLCDRRQPQANSVV